LKWNLLNESEHPGPNSESFPPDQTVTFSCRGLVHFLQSCKLNGT
jgi:hypothetical protein